MKKRLIYICMFASLLTFSSCNEALDVAPDGRLSLDEVFQDPDLTKAYFSTCFDYLPKKSLRYHFWSNYPVALSDEAWDCTDGSGAGFAHAASGNCTTTDFYLDVRRDRGDTYSEGGYWQLSHSVSAIRFSAELRQNDRRYNLEATNNIYLPGGRRVRGFVGIEPLVHPCP